MKKLIKLDPALLQSLTDIAEQRRLLECDGLTRVASHVFRSRNIDHKTMMGSLYQLDSQQAVESHFWIEIDNRILDFRARTWLGEIDAVPHGLFNPEDYSVAYVGDEVDMTISDRLFSVLLSV